MKGPIGWPTRTLWFNHDIKKRWKNWQKSKGMECGSRKEIEDFLFINLYKNRNSAGRRRRGCVSHTQICMCMCARICMWVFSWTWISWDSCPACEFFHTFRCANFILLMGIGCKIPVMWVLMHVKWPEIGCTCYLQFQSVLFLIVLCPVPKNGIPVWYASWKFGTSSFITASSVHIIPHTRVEWARKNSTNFSCFKKFRLWNAAKPGVTELFFMKFSCLSSLEKGIWSSIWVNMVFYKICLNCSHILISYFLKL